MFLWSFLSHEDLKKVCNNVRPWSFSWEESGDIRINSIKWRYSTGKPAYPCALGGEKYRQGWKGHKASGDSDLIKSSFCRKIKTDSEGPSGRDDSPSTGWRAAAAFSQPLFTSQSHPLLCRTQIISQHVWGVGRGSWNCPLVFPPTDRLTRFWGFLNQLHV